MRDMDARPAAVPNPDARINGVPVIYTYFTIPSKMKGLIPGWLWSKKVQNVNANQRVMSSEPSVELFKIESGDMLTLIDDFSRRKVRPFHIHLMVRQNGNIRVRVSWLPSPLEVLPDQEIDWIVMMLRRFAWDIMAHRSRSGTGHLPPHIALNCAHPVERREATVVQSVQVFNGELSAIYDPDAAQG